MLRFLARRLAAAALLLFLVLSAVFFLVHAAPGDPADLLTEERLPRAQRERLRALWGLDRPLSEQYAAWLQAVALRGDWGTSILHHRPVAAVLAEALPGTLLLAGSAFAVDAIVGLALGVAAARRRGRAADHLIRWGSLLVYSLPTFWLGLMAILLFSHFWPVLPAGHLRSVGAETLPAPARLLDLARHLLLPSLVLGLWLAGATARFVRNGLLEVLGQDYVRTARAAGVPERRVLWVHALRNAAVPVVQVFALTLAGAPQRLAGHRGGLLAARDRPRRLRRRADPRLPADPRRDRAFGGAGHRRDPGRRPGARRARPQGARCLRRPSASRPAPRPC